MFTKERINEILELCEKLPKGPWEWVEDKFYGGYSGLVDAENKEVLFPNCCNDGDEGAAWFEDYATPEVRHFIALARTALPQLAQRVVDLEKQLESLTPGGSEFYNDPERCIQWVKDRLATVSKQVKKRKEAEAENAKLRATIAAMQDALEEVKARCELRRQDDDAHYENYYEAKQALAAAGYRSNQP